MTTRCEFIADIGANHDGSLDRALALIRLAARAGADVVKFQSFTADTIVSREGFASMPKSAHQKSWAKDVVDVYRDAELPLAWLPHLYAQCLEAGVEFACTPYSLAAVDVLDPYVKRFKIGSGDITYKALLKRVAITDKPVLLGCGASVDSEVWGAVETLTDTGKCRLTLLHCNTDYTGGAATYSNLRVLGYWRDAWLGYGGDGDGVVAGFGLSDHTRSLPVVLGAVALGASVIERHFTDDRSREGPDHGFAMEPADWRIMVDAVRELESAMGDGVKKVEPNEVEARIVQRRAWRLTRDVPAGHVLRSEDVCALRPCPEGALTPMEDVVGEEMFRAGRKGEAVQRCIDLTGGDIRKGLTPLRLSTENASADGRYPLGALPHWAPCNEQNPRWVA